MAWYVYVVNIKFIYGTHQQEISNSYQNPENQTIICFIIALVMIKLVMTTRWLKAVQRIQFFGGSSLEIDVFTLKVNTWRSIQDVNFFFCFPFQGILLNGALHWVGFQREWRLILAFDLTKENLKCCRHLSWILVNLEIMGVLVLR